MGDQPEFPLTGVSVVSSPSKRCGSYCCWQGSTASRCDSINGDYSGCNRTLCTHYAAKKVCENLNYDNRSWRLPTLNELQRFGAYSINKGSSGLMLCNDNAGYGSTRCYFRQNSCKVSSSWADCDPHDVWSATTQDSSLQWLCYLLDNTWGVATNIKTHAASVRCVTEIDE